jgi:hypothetical protein
MFKKRIFFITLLLLLTLAPFILGKFGQKNSKYVYVYMISSGGEWWWQLKNTPEWLRDQIQVGDREISASGEVTAELEEVHRFGTSFDTTMLMKVKLKIDKSSRDENVAFMYKGEPLLVGKSLSLNLNTTQISGNIVALSESSEDVLRTDSALVKMKLHNVYPWFAESIKLGVLYTPSSKDEKQDQEKLGDRYVEVLSKKVLPSTETALTTINPQSGQKGQLIVSGTNSSRVDVDLELRVPVTKRNNVYYAYFLQPLKIGSDLYLSGNEYDLYGLVTEFSLEDNI